MGSTSKKLRSNGGARGKVSRACTCSKAVDEDVSAKLEALKNLVPARFEEDQNVRVKPDHLFRDTADYILRLRAHVAVLEALVRLYKEIEETGRLNS